MKKRETLRIGMPRVLNMYMFAPLFSGYLESLGLQPENLVYSEFTGQDMYRAGAGRGAIDPCFPSKIGIPHVYNLIFQKHVKKPLDAIFFPMIDTLNQPLKNCSGANACPTVTATPNAVKAAFIKEDDVFKENGIQYLDPILNIDDKRLLTLQMFQTWQPILGLSEEENERAIEAGFKAFEDYDRSMRKRSREMLDTLERENRLGIVMLGRVYHHDPGLNHEIMEEFQKLGYPVFSQSMLPMDEDILDRLFGEEVRSGVDHSCTRYSRRVEECVLGQHQHEDLGSEVYRASPESGGAGDQQLQVRTRCADLHRDRRIIENSGTPYFSFKDLDENKPTGSIKIRVETIDYFLKRYREDLLKKAEKAKQLEQQLAEYERALRMQLTHKSVKRERDVVIPFPRLRLMNRRWPRHRETIREGALGNSTTIGS